MVILRQNFRAFLHRCACGKDIVDKDDAWGLMGFEGFSLASEFDGSVQIFQSLASRQACLSGSGADALQGTDNGELEEGA